MRYLIIDEHGTDHGGKICREWNSLQDFYASKICSGGYYAGTLRALFLYGQDDLKEDIFIAARTQGRTAQKLAREQGKPVAEYVAFQEIGESDNWPWSKRMISAAVTDVEEAVAVLTRTKTTGNRGMDNQPEGKTEWAIELKIPETFSETDLNRFLRLSHDYIIARVLMEWAMLTCKDFVEVWSAKMEGDLAELKKISKRAAASKPAEIKEGWI